MTDTPAERPRTWGPMIGAAGVALVVVVGALIWWLSSAGVSDDQKVAIDACEALADDADLPAITRGEVTGPDSDGVMSVAWSFEDGSHGGCDVTVVDGVAGEPALVGDVAPSAEPSPSS